MAEPDAFDAGLRTSQGMWDYLAGRLEDDDVPVPMSLMKAIIALSQGAAVVSWKPKENGNG